MSFLDAIFQRRRDADAQAREQYRALLSKGDKITTREIAQLDQLTTQLNKTDDQASADADALAEAHSLAASMGDERELIRASKASARALSEHLASWEKVKADYTAKTGALEKARGQAGTRMQASAQARERLATLHRQFPDVVDSSMVPQSPRDENGNLRP
ncbi:MAG: hypothetical protein K8S99_06895 [Planctomycetes bacterium]|nr:hypothetical protein [Planctomycetota bacterium]